MSKTKKASSIRRVIARRMLESWQTTPRVTYERDINCDALAAVD